MSVVLGEGYFLPNYNTNLINYNEELTPLERLIRKNAFLSILEGMPCSVEDLSKVINDSIENIETVVNDLSKRGLIVTEQETGKINGSCGLSLTKSEHSLFINNRQLYAWCAIDAIGIPSALGVQADIQSYCNNCNKQLNFKMKDGIIVRSSEQDVRLWMVKFSLDKSIVGKT